MRALRHRQTGEKPSSFCRLILKRRGDMRSEEEVSAAIEKYADTVYRICILHLKNTDDTEDIFQDVFLRYALYDGCFASSEHEKAWIIRVTVNRCRDLLKSFFRKKSVSLEEFTDFGSVPKTEYPEVMEALMSLAPRYKDPLYLCYFEGYSAAEAAVILHRNVNTVYSLLKRGKEQMRKLLGEMYDE